MKPKELKKLEDIKKIEIDPDRLFYSATHEEILAGYTTDIYFVRTREIAGTLSDEQYGSGCRSICQPQPGVLAGVQEGLKSFQTQKCGGLCPAGRGSLCQEGSNHDHCGEHTGILAFMKRPCWGSWPAPAVGLLQPGKSKRQREIWLSTVSGPATFTRQWLP
jgi:hypothetical protein